MKKKIKGFLTKSPMAVLSVEDPLKVFLMSLNVFNSYKIFLEKPLLSGNFSIALAPMEVLKSK